MARPSCPACGTPLVSANRQPNGAIVCPKCGRRFRASAPAAPPSEPAPVVHASRYRRNTGGKSRLPIVLGVSAGAALLIAGVVVGFIVWGPKDALSSPAAPKDQVAQTPPPTTNPDNPPPSNPKPAPHPEPPPHPPDPPPPPPPDPTPPPPQEPEAWKEIALADAPPNLASQVVVKINALRKSADVGSLTLDPDASATCTAHAAYLARNAGRIAALGLNVHAEEADLPGQSDAGRKAATPATIAAKEPLTALADWAAAPAHRALILQPGLKTVGVGFARNAKDQWASVFEWSGAAPAPAGEAVLYPNDGQTRVPLYFPGLEVPDPVPDAPVKGAAAGFPITTTFPAKAPVKAAEAWLEDESGAAVDAWVSSPDKPANPNAASAQQNSIGIIAKAPLRPGVRYAVQVQARVDGREQRRAWTFLTAGADDLHRDFEDRFLARINAARESSGLEPAVLDPAASLACAAHARYVSLNFPAHPNLNRNDETPDWPGASADGRIIAAHCLCQPAVGSADHTVDLLMGSLAIRQAFLEPKVKQIGLGSSWLGANGGCWVLALPDFGEWAEVHPVILYPYPDQQGVLTLYAGNAPSHLPADAPTDKPAGQPVTVRFRWHKPTDMVTGRLTDAAGQEVPTWLSTPQKPLPNQAPFVVCLLPREPLRADETYTATVAALFDGKPWTKTWSFTTTRPADADLSRPGGEGPGERQCGSQGGRPESRRDGRRPVARLPAPRQVSGRQ